MGNYYTRIVRVYPKIDKTILNKNEISENIVKTALLDEELNVFDNKENNCIDFIWRSKRAGGKLGIDSSLVDVWEIRGGDYTKMFFNGILLNNPKYNGFFFFKFDEIEIVFEKDKIDKFQEIFYQFDIEKKILVDKKQCCFIVNISGTYSADNDYEIGIDENKINNLSKDEFLKLKGTDNFIEGIFVNKYKAQNLSNFLSKFYQFETDEEKTTIPYLGMQHFQLNFKKRPVAKISRNNGNGWQPWIYETMNWWDNCILPEWIEYKNNRTK
ncbi:hypothetical protein [Aquimarina algicola]|uniref:Uncharacterized protein n=1 Tax=Aquimarina algicola TaxID=2589995 RepID=A0A504IYZ4_9FLAO|nr:hypothetical protein [Aquimarina algicola]TPN80978.1 hypothetical protein FHK87_25880 [Aquimarina algicola]